MSETTIAEVRPATLRWLFGQRGIVSRHLDEVELSREGHPAALVAAERGVRELDTTAVSQAGADGLLDGRP